MKTAEIKKRRSLPGATKLSTGQTIYWWAEILGVIIFYAIYSTIRNLNEGGTAEALHHAKQLIHLQRILGIDHEATLQHWALHSRELIIAMNYFYGSFHFIVTAGAAIYLFRKHRDKYPFWRNTIGCTTALALVGFTFWPLMPPRLLQQYGYHAGYVDTLAKYPAFWSFNSGAVSKISNQFAAMPSVHCAWALWCACVLVPLLKHRWAKILAGVYPVFTVSVIVLTGNHYFLDAVGGFATLGVGYLLARVFTRAGRVSVNEPKLEPGSSPAQPDQPATTGHLSNK